MATSFEIRVRKRTTLRETGEQKFRCKVGFKETRVVFADAEDRDPTVPVDAVKKSDKWEGEDEDDDVKDAWDKSDDEDGDGDGDEDTEKAKDGGGGGPDAGTGAKRGKKKLAEKIAEREERMVAEMEAKAMALTPEAKLAEKMRLQKLEETANLQMARDMLGKKALGFFPVGAAAVICRVSSRSLGRYCPFLLWLRPLQASRRVPWTT